MKLTEKQVKLLDSLLTDLIRQYKAKERICSDSFYPKAIKEFNEIKEVLIKLEYEDEQNSKS